MTARKEYFSVTELAEVFSKTRQTIHNWIEEGRFPNYQRTSAGIIVPVADVDAVKEVEATKLLNELVRLGFQVPAFA